jgi:hypothetical protein
VSTFKESAGPAGSCTFCEIIDVQGDLHCFTPSKQNVLCYTQVSTGLRFDGWIGVPAGDAPAAHGQSDPDFCACGGVTGSADTDPTHLETYCAKNLMANCVLADHRTFQPPDGSPPLVPAGWQTITQYPHTQFPDVTLVHQQTSDIAPAVPAPFQGISLPLKQKPHQDQSNLRLALVKRPDAVRGLCGAPWLLHHADPKLQNPLSSAAAACASPSDDEDDQGEVDE